MVGLDFLENHLGIGPLFRVVILEGVKFNNFVIEEPWADHWLMAKTVHGKRSSCTGC